MKTIYMVWQGRHEDARLLVATEDEALAHRWARALNRTGSMHEQPDTVVKKVEITSTEPVEPKEGERVIVRDFDGVEHEAVLKLKVGPMHDVECDDDPWPCEHAFWAACWPTEVPGGGKGEHVWPIDDNWDRVRKAPGPFKPLRWKKSEDSGYITLSESDDLWQLEGDPDPREGLARRLEATIVDLRKAIKEDRERGP